MTIYKYRGYSIDGDLREGEIHGKSKNDAESALLKIGITSFSITEKSENLLNIIINLFENDKMSLSQIVEFTRDLSILLNANIPVDQSLRILSSQNSYKLRQKVTEDLLNSVMNGFSLSDALSQHEVIFDESYVNFIRQGEAIGNIALACNNLFIFLKRQLDIRVKIQGSLIYPAVLITLTIASTVVIVWTLIPNITPIFIENGKNLPFVLNLILGLQKNIGIFLSLLFILGLILYLCFKTISNNKIWTIYLERSYLNLPIVGDYLINTMISRFLSCLGALLKAGIPLVQALETSLSTIDNRYFNSEMAHVIELVRGGNSLSKSLSEITYLPVVVSQMTIIGEQTGKLDEMLLKISEIYEIKSQIFIERLMSLLVPTLTISIAIAVGSLIMTVMDAVLGINEIVDR